MKIFLVFNPVAGNGDNEAFLKELKEKATKDAIECDIFLTTGENDDEQIEEKLSQKNYTHIVAGGGDGTISKMSKHAIKHQLILGILPMGTSNGLATDLCIPDDPLEAFQLVTSSSFTINLDTIIVNDNYEFIHLGDVGANANLLARNDKTDKGKLGQAINAIKELKEDISFDYKITSQKEEWSGSANMIVFCNAKRYGTGIPLTKKSKPNDGMFELVIFKNIQLSTLVNSALAKIDEEFLNEEDREVIIAKKASIELKTSQLMQLDGEIIGDTKQIELKIGSKTVSIACGKDCPYIN